VGLAHDALDLLIDALPPMLGDFAEHPTQAPPAGRHLDATQTARKGPVLAGFAAGTGNKAGPRRLTGQPCRSR
jgi:hypothetical protein